MRFIRSAILTVICSVTLVSCGDKSTGSASRLTVVAYGALYNLNGQNTLTRGEMLFDGKVVSSKYLSPAGNIMEFDATFSTKPGQHSLAFRVTSQTSSPSLYQTMLVFLITMEGGEYDLPDRTQVMNTGDQIEYSFEIVQ